MFPILFNIYIEAIMGEVLYGTRGVKVGGKNIERIRFSDDESDSC